MEQLVYNFYKIDKNDYLWDEFGSQNAYGGHSLLPLWEAKYIIDVLDPSITFHISDDEDRYLQIKDINNTDITHTFTYYMQFKFLPELYKYLNKQKVICNEILTGFYCTSCPGEKTYEEVSAHLKKYLNIDSDPRELVSIRESSEATIITKESWMDFLRKKKLSVFASQNDFSELRTWITTISRGIDYESMHEYLLGRAAFTEHT
tara:strand:+ start:432 stop:1046 length:615 start_codon:yes stop_codon:yes gene_type:complete